MGDSTGAVHHTSSSGTIFYHAAGPAHMLNVLMGQRFEVRAAANYAVGGRTTANVVTNIANIATARASFGCNICLIMVGTNDINSNSIEEQTIKDNFDTILAAVAAQGMQAWIWPILPRSYWPSHTAEQEAARRQVLLNVNSYLASLADGKNVIYFGAVYDAFDDGNGDPKAGYTYDGLHPSPTGSFYGAQAMLPQVHNHWEDSIWPALETNLFSNPDLSGSGGTTGTGVTGICPDGLEIYVSSSGTKYVHGSRNADGSFKLEATITGGGTSDSVYILDRAVSGLTGGTSYIHGFAEMKFNIAENIRLAPIKLQEETGAGAGTRTAHLSLNKRNEDPIPFTEMGKKIFATERILTAATTAQFDFEIRFEMVSTTKSVLDVDIYRVGMIHT